MPGGWASAHGSRPWLLMTGALAPWGIHQGRTSKSWKRPYRNAALSTSWYFGPLGSCKSYIICYHIHICIHIYIGVYTLYIYIYIHVAI